MITALVIVGVLAAYAAGWYVGYKYGAKEVAIVKADRDAILAHFNAIVGKAKTDAAKVETTVQTDVKTAEDAAKKIV